MTFSGRILVVDDFADWRRFVRSALQIEPGLRVVAEVSDGPEAVQKAQELQPDLIILDIGLPTMNGIEAGKQILKGVPHARILFFTETRSWEVVQEALRVGVGYVIKADARAELLPAVEAALGGRRFLSSTLAGRNLDKYDSQVFNNCETLKFVAPLAPQNVRIRHEVQFYADDGSLVNGFAGLVQRVLRVGNTVVVSATAAHRKDILSQLRAADFDMDAAIEGGSYISLDAAEVLAAIMVDGAPDLVRCENLVNELIVEPAKRRNGAHPRIAMCGELAPTLLSRGDAEGAIRLEHHWDAVSAKYNIDVLCGYLWKIPPDHENGSIFQRICAEHSTVHGHQLAY